MEPQTLVVIHQLSHTQIDELIRYAATDPALQKWTSDPVRFETKLAVEEWSAKVSSITVLTNRSGKLLGLGWVQDESFPQIENCTLPAEEQLKFTKTSAVRLYGEARGKGLSKWFYKQVLSHAGNPNIWDRVSADNTPSVKLHEAFGFKQVSMPDSMNKIILVRYSDQNSLQ